MRNRRSQVGSVAEVPGETVIGRLRRGLAEANLDCGCRQTANDLLDRVGTEDEQARRVKSLAEARGMRDAIVVILALLGELDELTPDEPDRTAFAEVSALFQDIADFASRGAVLAMQAAGRPNA
ncbi:hypothetical protein [Mesorhizobium sp. Z1-4]|uniref:hypothetical protein n=1 Tax=Mesorhizobium sp. Z1-4 TaxID=2448478 RepID=UPI000FDAC45D|nr:hypothetical protein [Mesorhizobium sp. Z1-4]